MEPGKVQGSNVTTFLSYSPPRGRLSWPYPVLGAWLDRLSEKKLGQLTKTEKAIPPLTTHSTSILMKAPKGVNNTGCNVWWEEVELWVTSKGSKGKEPYILTPSSPLKVVKIVFWYSPSTRAWLKKG